MPVKAAGNQLSPESRRVAATFAPTTLEMSPVWIERGSPRPLSPCRWAAIPQPASDRLGVQADHPGNTADRGSTLAEATHFLIPGLPARLLLPAPDLCFRGSLCDSPL